MIKDCTVLITLHYSSTFIKDLVNYFDNQSLFEVFIVDSTIQPLDFNIPKCFTHIKIPNKTPFSEKMHQALSQVKTKYVIWNPDDDFVCFEGLISGIHFLNNNRDYNSFYGQTIFFNGKFRIYPTKSNSINQANSTERLKYGFQKYDNRLNAVMKSSDLLNFYELYKSDFKTPSYLFEFTNAFYFLNKGKVKYSSIPFIFRRQMENSAGKIEFKYLKLWTQNKYLEEKNNFVELLASKEDVSRKLVKKCLSHIYTGLTIPYLFKYVLYQTMLKLGFYKIKKYKAYKILINDKLGLKHK